MKSVFISVANSEHLAFRSLLRDELTRTRFFHVVVQPEFAHTATDTVRKLDREIKRCDLLIHIVGQAPGSRANDASVDNFFQHTPRASFLAKLPKVGAVLGDFSQLTYFQWEVWLALHHAIPVLVYAESGHEQPDFPQRGHLDALHLARCHAETLPDAERCARIMAAICHHFGIIPNAPTQHIAASRIINHHTADDFIGRETELEKLDAAWAARDAINLQCVIAWGGVGKTALLARWVQTRFRDRGWKDQQGQADPVIYFDWTFYDQGTRADDATQAGAASIGTFFVEALRHFGDPQPDQPDDKARRLAGLVQKQRCLIVLDGLEPLQYPYNHPQAGQLTDPDLAQFLRLLAQQNPGLCLISSREGLTELRGHYTSSAPHHDLEDLPPEAAIALLRKLGVVGSDADLRQAAADYQHHALSLILLGRFLAMARGGDIRQRDTVSFQKADDKRSTQTRSAWHVLETTEHWLASPGGNPTDLQALRLIGLFDRPASPDCLDVLRQAPAIAELTDRLVPLDTDDWNAVLRRLHAAQLIQLKFPPRDSDSQAPHPQPRQVSVDAHPLVREYFAKRLRESQPDGFRAAHSRLFDYLCGSTEYRPDTLDGLQPLYQAVVHGCLAGQHEVAVTVYDERILRGVGEGGYFSSRKLGAIGENLSAVTAFFEQPWTLVSPKLSEDIQVWLLSEVAFYLRALGRLNEALEPMRVAAEKPVVFEDWIAAAKGYSNLSQLEVTLGRLGEAEANALRALEFADRSGDVFEQITKCAILADALHQSGELDEARELFKQTEALQRSVQPQFEVLYSGQGFMYCDLILALAEHAALLRCGSMEQVGADTAFNLKQRDLLDVEVSALVEAEHRATLALKWSKQQGSLLSFALDHLTLARVVVYRVALAMQPRIAGTNPHLAYALAGLRKAGQVQFLAKALLTAAHWHALTGDHTTARDHLAEAQHIAERGPMPLYLADVHLHRARLVGMLPPDQRAQHWPGIDPKSELAKARALIEEHGYWRRREELADAEAASIHW